MDFKTYHLCTEATESQFAAEFNQLVAFLRKWDQLGLEKYAKIVGTGYFRVLYDFLSALHRGDSPGLRRQALNVVRLIPSTVLFGTAVPLAGILDLGQAGFLMLGLKLIQYAYWPFWSWASNNLKHADPEIARRASLVVSAIPDQWRAILASESISLTY